MAKGYNKNQGSRFSDGIVSEGHITLNGSLWLPDAAVDTGPNDEDPGRIYFGNGNDMNISVSGSKHGVVRQVNTDGSLYLQSANINGGEVIISNNGASETLARFKNGPDVTTGDNQYVAGCFLYHNNVQRFSTLGSFAYGSGTDNTENCDGGVKIHGPAKAAAADLVAGQPMVDSSLKVARIVFDQGINTNDHCMIKWVSTENATADRCALDFVISDNASDTVTQADKFRFRYNPHLDTINSANEYSLVEISAKADGSTRMDLTTLVMDEGETRTSEVIADKFTGEASTVAALDNAAGTLTTDNLTQGATNKYFSTAQVDSHISVTTGDASGGGSLSYTTGTFTFAPAQLASTSTAGIASFSSNDFAVSAAGDVTLNSLKNGDIASDAAIAYSKLANVAKQTFLGNNTNAAASAIAMTPSQARALLGNIANNADNYDGWNINHKEDANDTTAHTATKIGSAGNVKFVGDGATKVTRDSGTVTITSVNDDTTYTCDADYGTVMEGTSIRLNDDRRRNKNAATIKDGNTQEYIVYNHDVNGAGSGTPGAIQFFTENVEEMRLDKDGNLHVNGDIVGFSGTISDERLKENIKTVDNALDKVSQLKGVTFDWEKSGEASAGLIAQDLEKVLPSAVKERELALYAENKEYKTVEYSQVTALLIEAIKELKEQNTQLRADIEELKVNK
jgi:hypothetical protein